MTKREEIFKAFINDEKIIDKNYLTQLQVETLKITDVAPNKFVDVLKIIINSKEDGDSDSIILRKINNFLSKTL